MPPICRPRGRAPGRQGMGKRTLGLLVACVLGAIGAGSASAQTTFRVVNHSDLKILDPIWTTAYIVRNHGYMIYDTLFALDGNLEVKPQMVDTWKVSDPKTFQIVLKAPTGIMLQALGKPSGNAFIMPKKVAETDAAKQI